MRRGYTLPSPLTWPSNLEIQWHIKACNNRLIGWLQSPAGDPACRDPHARGHHKGFISRLFSPPKVAAGERLKLFIKAPLGALLLNFPQRYILKSFPQEDSSARQLRFEISFPSPRWAAKGHRATPARLPVTPLATRSKHVVFAYDQVVRPHRSYHPSGGLPIGSLGPATGRLACNCLMAEVWTTEASTLD